MSHKARKDFKNCIGYSCDCCNIDLECNPANPMYRKDGKK